jgi:hypothetical protein
VTLRALELIDEHPYTEWAAPCRWCEVGAERRIAWAKRGRVMPTYELQDVDQVGVAA